MIVTRTLQEFDVARRALQGRVAFVPTMGALHEGHLDLVRMAKDAADFVVVSIFVNPTQFAPHEDFASYPRDVTRDATMLESVEADVVFLPDVEAIYPDGPAVTIKASAASHGLESESRPHFFDGVCSVVSRLFDIVRPDIAVFGEKDFQQLQVIREMVEARNMGIDIIGAPITRDELGLALSSRNAYLSAEELEIARMLNQVVYKVAFDVNNGADAQDACQEGTEMLMTCGFKSVDYLAYRSDWQRVLVAAWLGKTRLIDNCATV